MLLNAAAPGQALTGPIASCRFATAVNSAHQQVQLSERTGPHVGVLGSSIDDWATDGSELLLHGDTVALVATMSNRAYDCAGPRCSSQPLIPPAGWSLGHAILTIQSWWCDRRHHSDWRRDLLRPHGEFRLERHIVAYLHHIDDRWRQSSCPNALSRGPGPGPGDRTEPGQRHLAEHRNAG